VAAFPASAAYWFARSFWSQVKFFADDKALAKSKWDPRRWFSLLARAHIAWWSGKNYDQYVDREIPTLRHALAIDEDRAKFPRVLWGRPVDVAWHEARGRKDWLVQMWFAGNHSDIGGSYPEEESRLSDIALHWMIGELQAAMGNQVTVLADRVVTAPDARGLQHSERISMLDSQPTLLRWLTFGRLVWGQAVRTIHPEARLHPSVLDRLAAPHVPQMGEVKAYRPVNLAAHEQAKMFYRAAAAPLVGQGAVAASTAAGPKVRRQRATRKPRGTKS